MSYILDALKKVELEKLKKSAPSGVTIIAGDLFQERTQRPVSGGRWKIILLIVIASSITFAGTWFMLRGKPDNVPHSAPAVSPAAIPATPLSAAPIAAPAPVQAVTAPAVGITTPQVQSPAPLDGDVENRDSRAAKRPSMRSAPVAVPLESKPSQQTMQPPADIKLSGIAWQDERTARRAVVNGFLLKEGGVVSGARITEIMSDRVRFTLPGGTFEIRLDAATATEVRR